MTRKWIGALAVVGAALVSVGTAGPVYAATGTHLSSSPTAGGGGGIGDNVAPNCGGGGGVGSDD